MRDRERYNRTERLGGGAESGDCERLPTGEDCLDAVYTLLSARRRRYLLDALDTCETPVPLAAVADRITEWEYGVPADDVPDERLRVYMSLYHEHIPMLEEYDVVAYSQETDTLERGTNATPLHSYLKPATRESVVEGTATE